MNTAPPEPSLGDAELRGLLRRLFDLAVATARPEICVPQYLPPAPAGRLIVTGAGKAAAAMAQALEANWDGPIFGSVVTRHGYSLPTRHVQVLEAGHPVPDEGSEQAARKMLELARSAGPDDLVLFLLSGGGSALMAAPADGLTLADKQAVTKALLASGATITEINCVRRHLSAIKGGRLAVAAHPAPIITLAISDVPGDDPEAIASGPTVADPSTFADARAILEKYNIDQPLSVLSHLKEARDETAKAGDPGLESAEFRMIARPAEMLEAAKIELDQAGYTTVLLGDSLEGEARDVAGSHAALAKKHADEGGRTAILSGGELTVTITGKGRGGPNREYALALALALDSDPRIAAMACDTDGADGAAGTDGGDVAGGVITPDTLSRAQAAGLDAADRLADNDAGGFFERLGDAVITGPTQTNVNDFRCILIG
jgi:hydroxypyruvate reductase